MLKEKLFVYYSMRKATSIDFFSHVTMTKTFSPLLANQTDSRIVNICSVNICLASTGMASIDNYFIYFYRLECKYNAEIN